MDKNLGSLDPVARGDHVGVPDVHRVVDAQPDSEDNVHAGDDVDGDVPEVEEANNVDKGEDDGEEDHEADGQVGQQDEGDDEDASHGEADVSPELKPNDLVRLPGCVDLVEAEGRVTKLLGHCLVHSLACGYMLLWPVELEVKDAELDGQNRRRWTPALQSPVEAEV